MLVVPVLYCSIKESRLSKSKRQRTDSGPGNVES